MLQRRPLAWLSFANLLPSNYAADGLNLGEAKEKDQNRDEGDLLSAEDVELEAKARTCFFHPNMPIRTTWDLVQVTTRIPGYCRRALLARSS